MIHGSVEKSTGSRSMWSSTRPGGVAEDDRPCAGLAAAGIGSIGCAAVTLALQPSIAVVFEAEVLHGVASGILTPAIGAISLGLAGRRGMSSRIGRNYRFAAAGNALTAAAILLANAPEPDCRPPFPVAACWWARTRGGVAHQILVVGIAGQALTHKTAFTNRRLSSPCGPRSPFLPGRRSLIRRHCSFESI
jgi:hypothetical protein